MDLTKIIINYIRANEVRSLIDALEELPPETIQGNFHTIEADQDRSTGVIRLSVMYHNEEIKNSIKINVPKDSNILNYDDGLEFEYNNRTYNLKRVAEISIPT